MDETNKPIATDGDEQVDEVITPEVPMEGEEATDVVSEEGAEELPVE